MLLVILLEQSTSLSTRTMSMRERTPVTVRRRQTMAQDMTMSLSKDYHQEATGPQPLSLLNPNTFQLFVSKQLTPLPFPLLVLDLRAPALVIGLALVLVLLSTPLTP
jgi:hypothetical protein